MSMHETQVRQRALSLLRAGVRNADVARELNVPRGTIGKWKHVDRLKRGESAARRHLPCPRCDGRELDQKAYAYLLGLYLGDGNVSQPPTHRTASLRITLDDAWPGRTDRGRGLNARGLS